MLLFNKSSDPDLLTNTIVHKLDLLLREQVEQRKDLSIINALLKTMLADSGIQKQVDNYFEDDETSPQTDSDNKEDLD